MSAADDDDVTDLLSRECGVDVHLARGRGRPPLSPELRRTAKLNVSFTADEMARIMHVCADSRDEEGNPMDPKDWARRVLLDAAERGS